jgi:lipopolysaccharide export system permease protein
MNILIPKRYFIYLFKLYVKNLLAILLGLSLAFAAMDYFQNAQKLSVSGSYKILYVFYKWEQALGLLYPLSMVFALIMTKLTLIRHNTMGAFHAFGYDKKTLIRPFLVAAFIVYGIFTYFNTTEFAYAEDKATLLIKNQMGAYNVNNLFFKYNDTFVYIDELDPIGKKLNDITIFKVEGYQVRYTINAPLATFDGYQWDAQNATLRTHIYDGNGELIRYKIEKKEHIQTLEGYKPKIIESLYEGKALNIVDAYNTWVLLNKQNLNSDKIRAVFYNKVIVPFFAIALLIILFFRLPFHARMMNMGAIIALSLGSTFVIWGILFGLNQMGTNGVIIPEVAAIAPVVILWTYAIYIFFTNENTL